LKPADAAADPGNVVGRRLTGPVTDREPVTANRLLGTALTRGLRAGLVAAPVGIDDPHVAELVHPGERVDLLATRRPPEIGDTSASDPGAVTTVAHSALVLAAFAGRDGAGSEVVLAVDRAVAVAITRDSRTDVFTVVAGPP
jgi:Flp pilus assembly protein CpaB